MADNNGAARRRAARKASQLALSWRDGASPAVGVSPNGEVARSTRAKLTLKFGVIAASNGET